MPDPLPFSMLYTGREGRDMQRGAGVCCVGHANAGPFMSVARIASSPWSMLTSSSILSLVVESGLI